MPPMNSFETGSERVPEPSLDPWKKFRDAHASVLREIREGKFDSAISKLQDLVLIHGKGVGDGPYEMEKDGPRMIDDARTTLVEAVARAANIFAIVTTSEEDLDKLRKFQSELESSR